MLAKSFIIVLLTITILRPTILIDPEYVLDKRIKQVLLAVNNAIEDIDKYEDARSLSAKGKMVTFWCKKPNQSGYQQVLPGDPNITLKLNFTIPTAFLIHGWFDSVNRTWINKTMSSYVRNLHSNICGVDWSRLALTEYTIAANNTKIVAKYLQKFIEFLIENGVELKQITLIGHSMGAQIAGMTGGKFNGKISEIIGLDPAGWLFTKPTLIDRENRLDKSDAQFVQCIHTAINYIGLGSDVDCGHQDYYPNGGLSPQPGCHNPAEESGMTYTPLICSHYKAVQYFLHSLDRKNEFRGYTCSLGYFWWNVGLCNSKYYDIFGPYSKKVELSPLYLRTSPYPPFTSKLT